MRKKLDDKDKNNFQNLADELKPREQMASLPSVTMMSSSSLLAIMLGHGVNGINVLELSNRLITAFGSATELAKADWRMVIEHIREYNEEHPQSPIKGIGKVRAQTLCAAFEFVRRAYDAHDEDFKKNPYPFAVSNRVWIEDGQLNFEIVDVDMMKKMEKREQRSLKESLDMMKAYRVSE